MEGLGKDFNVIYNADDVFVNLRDYAGVTFVGYEDGGASVFTITTSTAASGGTTATADIIDHYYTSNGVGGVWTKRTQTAAETVSPSDDTDQDCVAIYVGADMLADGESYVKCARDQASGTTVAILHGLNSQRDPANLPSAIV